MEDEVTATSKNTPIKPTKRPLRQNMVRNVNVYNRHVKKHLKENNYIKALRALHEGRNNNHPAHKQAFNSLISDQNSILAVLKKKNPKWSRTSVDDHDLTARTLFMEDNTDEEL